MRSPQPRDGCGLPGHASLAVQWLLMVESSVSFSKIGSESDCQSLVSKGTVHLCHCQACTKEKFNCGGKKVQNGVWFPQKILMPFGYELIQLESPFN